ncbi:GDSL esterase/lipase At4g01130 isoform X2 [Benincasa hispida]|uniref:GDSL esterase/lipase At4g01130 isoform X2 n=1 Tax=Benincasa hispida TaxID=102211 RepID=UPI0018FFCE73|nr:GDSL esterase/lipase At4g01130 isoform X2 [Benincasa hispida]
MTLLLLQSSPPFLKIFVLVLLAVASAAAAAHSKCEFKAIFNFGDSNSDTGGFWAVFPAQHGPNGMTFFKKPTGRATDGRLILDFLAKSLGLPFISPYLKSIGSDFKHGANFATLASTVLLPNTSLFVTGISPFSLAIQLNQMKEFKFRVDEYHSSSSHPKGWTQLPPPNIFGKALYTFYIGQNDFTSNLKAIGIEGVKQYLPQVVSQIVDTIKEVYKLGGRTFVVMNMAPVGCYPALLVELPHRSSDIDQYGCFISYNKAVSDYNVMLKKELEQARRALPKASLLYFDTHSVLLQLFQHPNSHGLKYGTKACCGHGGGPYNFDPTLFCGNSKNINNKILTATACSDPYNYVSWDGIHATEAANKLVTLAILNGSYSHPPFSFQNLCDLRPLD